jgi:hypothetical protein
MATTRSIADNPLHPNNWPKEPETPEELEIWMEETKKGLLAWLKRAQNQVLGDAKTQSAIKQHDKHANSVWQKHERNTDVETGIVDQKNRGSYMSMLTAMKTLQDTGARLHVDHATWPKHVERKFADEAWEDFHYYQNVWNRRCFDPTSTYHETESEKDAAKKAEEGKSAVAWAVAPLKRISVPLKSKDTWGDYAWLYWNWRNHMINLFIRCKLGYRKHAPDIVRPEDAHRYSQPPRGTTKRELESYDDRHKYLEICFPRRKRTRTTENGSGEDDEVEEQYPSKVRLAADEELERGGHMEEIIWHLDDEAVKKLKLRKELEITRKGRKAGDSGTTGTSVPTGHVLHHGSLETSFYWPTAFDSASQDDALGLTINRKRYLYERESNVRGLNEKDKADRTEEETGRVRKIEEGIRYRKVQSGNRIVNDFRPDLDSEGNVRGRDRNGKWHGRQVTKTVPRMIYERVARKKRVPLPPRFQFYREFEVRLKAANGSRGTRHGNLEAKGKMNEVSDDEERDYTKENKNYKWSANETADQVDGVGGTEENGQDKSTPGRSNDEDIDTDDEGDLFRQSYEECF